LLDKAVNAAKFYDTDGNITVSDYRY
jgi:hypothetical protein